MMHRSAAANLDRKEHEEKEAAQTERTCFLGFRSSPLCIYCIILGICSQIQLGGQWFQGACTTHSHEHAHTCTHTCVHTHTHSLTYIHFQSQTRVPWVSMASFLLSGGPLIFFALEVHKLFVCFGGKFLMDVFSSNISYILRVVFLLSLWFPLLCHFF